MNLWSLVAPLPPWLLLALALGALFGAAYKTLLPRTPPGLLVTSALLVIGLTIGHLLAILGNLPAWGVGDLRLVPGLAIGAMLVWLAKTNRV